MTIERSRQLGKLLMAVSGVSLAIFLAGVVRRSYLVLAIPVAILAGATAGLTFWVGYTMAGTRWEADDLGEYDTPEAPPGARSAASPDPEHAPASGYGLRP
ncbi:MAG: hypothetical protein U0360_10090 [Dehalococcoidia bacterium]